MWHLRLGQHVLCLHYIMQGTGMEYQASSGGAAGVITYYMIPFPNFLFCQLCSIAFGVFSPPLPPPRWKGWRVEHIKRSSFLFFFVFFCGVFFLFVAIIMFVHTKKKDDEVFLFVFITHIFAGLAFTSRGAAIHISRFQFYFNTQKEITSF